MSAYSVEYYIKNNAAKKYFIGDEIRCSYNNNMGESAGCWHGILTRVTTKGIYIDVGNKRDKYVAFVQISEISLE